MGERFRMRMADRIQRDHLWQEARAGMGELCRCAARESVRIVIDSVFDLMMSHDNRTWYFDKDFPWSLPPYAATWMEFLDPDGALIGASVRHTTCDEFLRRECTGAGPASTSIKRLIGSGRHLIGMAICTAAAGNWTVGAVHNYVLDGDGGYVGAYQDCGWLTPEQVTKAVLPFMYSLSLLNCRGVSKIRVPPPPQHIRKSIIKKTGKPLLIYKTLCIDAFRKELSKNPTLEEINRTIRLHMRRGNIANYTAEKPHVSGYVGPMWRSSCVVGRKKNGVVVKDYRVTTR